MIFILFVAIHCMASVPHVLYSILKADCSFPHFTHYIRNTRMNFRLSLHHSTLNIQPISRTLVNNKLRMTPKEILLPLALHLTERSEESHEEQKLRVPGFGPRRNRNSCIATKRGHRLAAQSLLWSFVCAVLTTVVRKGMNETGQLLVYASVIDLFSKKNTGI
jgi:hypothetical protein